MFEVVQFSLELHLCRQPIKIPKTTAESNRKMFKYLKVEKIFISKVLSFAIPLPNAAQYCMTHGQVFTTK